MLKHRINHQRYDILICRIVKVRLHLIYLSIFLKNSKPLGTVHISNMFPEFMS